MDEETGLYYFGARYYDPRTSVWQSADPIFAKYLTTGNKEQDKNLPGMGGIYNSFNLGMYSYGHLNPVRYTDPDGNATWPSQSTELVSGGSTGYIGYYGWVRDGGRAPHFAVDIKTPVGSPIYAFERGRVIAAGWENPANQKKGYGLRIVLEHERDGQKYQSVYGHLSSISPEVQRALKGGKVIPEGVEIGESGRTGNVRRNDPDQLHFELPQGTPYKQPDSGADPAEFFGTWDRIKNFLMGRPIPETRPPQPTAE